MSAVGVDPPALLDGRYRLGECVGEGGMARVYRAEDVILGRTVAIKLIRPGVDGASSERARSEVTLLASLNHPSLVTLFDARLVPGEPEYLAMEFVDGPTLASRVASGGPLPAEMAGHLAAELAEALHVVHTAGIVHRDIKPSNVLLSPAPLPGARPRAKLADFGIAYLLDASRLTSPGLVIGTVAYLAPEQIRGGEPAPASDIYSLALVLLEALTGERVHPHGAGMAAALARLESPPPIPASLDRRWADLLTRMMRLEPSERPTAAEVAIAAHHLTERVPAVAPETPRTQTDATAALTAPTLLAPAEVTAPTLLAPVAATVPASSAPASGGQPLRDRRRRRLIATIGGALAAAVVATAAIIGISTLAGSPQTPDPALTVPAEDPSDVPPDDTGNDIVVGPGMTDEERKAAEKERKRLEEEQKKREEEQRKQQEEEQKRLEREQRDDDD
ncbi:serine/threonine-protein kinase [Microbacterium cremeum]|uniref:serine/threonine-protein kinase n=1 Tax=Microbacterium cremeum TaxID=2782169 RepID=UPI0018888664|nr:serine/threonine-protein kinase [Microbacterium cremeum]